MSEQHKHDPDTDDRQDDHERPGFFQVLHSVLAAIFGVQSSGNRELHKLIVSVRDAIFLREQRHEELGEDGEDADA